MCAFFGLFCQKVTFNFLSGDFALFNYFGRKPPGVGFLRAEQWPVRFKLADPPLSCYTRQSVLTGMKIQLHSGRYYIYLRGKLLSDRAQPKICLYQTSKMMSPISVEIPWTEYPGGLQSIGSQRVPRDWWQSMYETYLRLFLIKTLLVFVSLNFILGFN